MNPKRVLSKETIVMRLKSNSKDGVIEELIDVLVASGKIQDRKAALKAVVDREKKMSTGLQNGIAIPHGKTDTIESLVAAIGICPDGIAFESLDGLPAQIILLTVSPASRTGPHIQFLADVSRVLHNEETRKRVLSASTEEDVLDLLSSEGSSAPST
ncbi:MAG TPA: PTS sugar transporter subunit IIA [Kiritimatiellia bacterium]|nr:PTS sugar transporter subunit IIA [Kiritimatiellia bacterium]